MLARYREGGPAGLVSGRRGKPSNNAMAEAARREAMEWVRERHPDFGPTFAREKLVEVHGLRLSAETLRKWMIADGLWRAKARREVRAHLAAHGRPVAYYSDRHSVFRVNKKDREDALTQFSRALRTLYIGRSARAAARHLRHGGGREADSGGERQNRARERRRGEGGAAGAAGLQAAAGPSWRRPFKPAAASVAAGG